MIAIGNIFRRIISDTERYLQLKIKYNKHTILSFLADKNEENLLTKGSTMN